MTIQITSHPDCTSLRVNMTTVIVPDPVKPDLTVEQRNEIMSHTLEAISDASDAMMHTATHGKKKTKKATRSHAETNEDIAVDLLGVASQALKTAAAPDRHLDTLDQIAATTTLSRGGVIGSPTDQVASLVSQTVADMLRSWFATGTWSTRPLTPAESIVHLAEMDDDFDLEPARPADRNLLDSFSKQVSLGETLAIVSGPTPRKGGEIVWLNWVETTLGAPRTSPVTA